MFKKTTLDDLDYSEYGMENVIEDEYHYPENQEVGKKQEVDENQEVENVNEEVSKFKVPISDSESSPEPDDECNKETILENIVVVMDQQMIV